MKRIRTKKNTKKYRKTTKTRRIRKGGGEKEKKEKMIKDNFRNMFLRFFQKFKTAIESHNTKLLNASIESLTNGFKSNQMGINTLIPVTNNTIPVNKYNYKADVTPIIAFVPLLVVIFDNIDDNSIRKILVASFIKNKGNINLQSYVKNISALSSAIKLQDKELVTFLLKNGADIKILSEEQKIQLETLIKEPEIEQIIEPEPETPIIKLILPTDLPSVSGYDPSVEPEFWKPLFGENNMMILREKINNMMNVDSQIRIINGETSDLWSVCKINQAMIPTYFTQTKNEPYEFFGTFYSDTNVDFSHYNIILCASLIIFGIISQKMIGQDYKLIFKGGKAIQLELASIQDTSSYKTEDIDILILPDASIPYDEIKIKSLSGHLAYLMRWFLNNPETQYVVSVLEPNPTNLRANPFIFKLSYVKTSQRFNPRTKTMVADFKQFSDIDFKDIPQNVKPFFDNYREYPFNIEELGEKVLFRCPNIGSLLDEKIYYYSKYFGFKKMLQERKPITEPGYERLNIIECDRYLDKFKRAILSMNAGLQKQRNPGIMPEELLIKEMNSIKNRLDKLGIKDADTKEMIINSLYK